jgi:lysozyme
MKTSEAGIHLMHKYEGYRNKPYQCPAHLWTVGWGHVMYPEQAKLPIVRKEGYTGMIRSEFPLRPKDNRVWSREELVEIFKQDLNRFETGVVRLCPNTVNSQSHFDALVCFSFNAGLGNLQRSQIRMKYNRGDFEGAVEELLTWNKGGGKVLPGLVKRRNEEKALFFSAN